MSLEAVPVGTETKELCKRIVRNAKEMPKQGLDKDAASEVLECIRWTLTKMASSNTLEPVVCTPTVKPGANYGEEQKGGREEPWASGLRHALRTDEPKGARRAGQRSAQRSRRRCSR